MGPLASLRVVEFAGLGPAPMAGQLLADLGADVISVDRASGDVDVTDVHRRGKRSIALNLKQPRGQEAAARLIATSDILIEGFRPGVMERLGLGPAQCPERLIYGRMTGWGQTGPWAKAAGHDINYLAMTGALHAIGPAEHPPVAPLNLAADYGGGAMFLLFGILSAVIERTVSGKGQVVDAAMVDGVPAMMGLIHTLLAQRKWSTEREANWLDGAAPFYRCYECADGKFISVGALEPQFFRALLRKLDLPEIGPEKQNDPADWANRRATFAAVFRTKPRDVWMELFAGTDACVAPVLDFREAALHPVNAARDVFYDDNGTLQASPAPRFARSTPPRPPSPTGPGAQSGEILTELGYTGDAIKTMRETGALT
jgi:alpha-methylacyl-CoA racemase